MAATLSPWRNSTSLRASERFSSVRSSSPSIPLPAAGDDRQAGGAPLGQAVLQSAHVETARAQRRHRFVGENAVRAAAVGDDLLGRIELGEARFQLTQRNVHGARQMAE